eukprot:scaffold307088_cov33-Prasinocladus_malaysianus.AAC.1
MSLAKAARSDNAVPEGQHASASQCPLANGNVSPAVGSFLQRIVAFKDPESGKPLSDPAVNHILPPFSGQSSFKPKL